MNGFNDFSDHTIRSNVVTFDPLPAEGMEMQFA